MITQTTPFTLNLKSESTIYQTQVRCHVNENEYNMTLNPTVLEDGAGTVKSGLLNPSFQPYVTTVGLYNDRSQLLAVAKLGQPLPMPSNTDVTFLVRYDT
jgi:hypothetical protein